MKLDWAILCNSGEVQTNLAYVLGGGWDTAWRAPFPAPFGGALVLRFLLNRSEIGRAHQLELHFLDEDGTPIAPAVGLAIGAQQAPPGWPHGWDIPGMVALGLQTLLIPKAGMYAISILIDGSHVKDVAFQFLEGTPTQPGGA